MSLSLQSNRDNQLYDQQLFNSMTSPMRRPLYLPGPMAKGNMFEGLQMFGDAFTDLKNTFSNRKLKKELYKQSLPEYYRYTVEKDPNDPNEYVLDNRDLYDAMMGEGTLRTPDVYQSDLQKYSMVNFDPESGMYNTMYSSRPINEDLYSGYSDIFGEGSKSLGQFLEDMQGNPELMDLIIQAEGAPEGFFPYMEPDGRMGVTEDPDYLQYYYNTMMGNYEMGGSLPKAQVGISLFDPNAIDAGIGGAGGGAGLRSNPNVSTESLSQLSANLRDFFNRLRGLKLFANEYGGSLPEAQFLGALKDGWNSFTTGVSDVYDDVSEAISETVEDVKNTAWTYANPYNYTRGTGYDNPVSAIGGYLMGDENAISGPVDYSGSAGNKDDAFAQAREELGPGKSFIYDGVRYTTDYYGQTEDKNTKNVLGMLQEGIGEDYDQATYDRFIEVWNQMGQPPLNYGADYEPGFLAGFSPSFQEVTDVASSVAGKPSRVAPHVNPITSPSSGGNIYVTEDKFVREDNPTDYENLMEWYVKELSHSKQLREQGRLDFMKDYIKDLFHAHGDQLSTYKTPGTVEHEAHEILEKPMLEYVFGTSDYNYGGSLPKAQFRTPLEESFANDPPEKIVSTLEKSKRIGDEDYEISMNSYLPEIVIEAERGEQDKGSTLGEMLRFDELLNQPESNEFRINPEYDPNTAIIDNTNVVMPQFDMEGNYMGEGSVNTNVSQYLGDSGGDKRSDLEKMEPLLEILDYAALVGAFTPAYPLAYGYSMARALQKRDPYAGGADLVALGAKRHPAVQGGLKVFGKLGPKIPSLINKLITKTPARDPIEESIYNVYDELMSIPEYSKMGTDYIMEQAQKIGQGLYDSYKRSQQYQGAAQSTSPYQVREYGGLIKAQAGLSFEQWAAQNAVRISGMNEAEARRAYDQDTMDPQEFGEKYMDIDFTVDEVPMPRIEDDPETMPFDLALGDVEIDEVPMPRLEDDVVIADPTVTGKKDNLSRFLDSPFAQGYGAIGRSAVGVAQGLDQMFGLDRVARQAKEDLMKTTAADNAFMVTNPLMPQGRVDVNTGLSMTSGGFGLKAKFGTETEMEVEADPETIKALIDAGVNVNYI